MLSECKKALRITADVYDGELCSLMDAGARDLEIAGVELPGTVAFQATNQGIVDSSTLTRCVSGRSSPMCGCISAARTITNGCGKHTRRRRCS